MPSIWIARLSISTRTAHKIAQLHGLTPDEVRDAVQCRSGLLATRKVDPVRGERFYVETWIRGRRVLVALYPRLHGLGDSWNLGSAYPIDS